MYLYIYMQVITENNMNLCNVPFHLKFSVTNAVITYSYGMLLDEDTIN